MKRRLHCGVLALIAIASAVSVRGQNSTDVFAAIEPLVTDAIARHQLPGAVVLIGRGDAVVYTRAFGQRAVQPSAEPMTEDTIFDLASLTKVVATTTSVMQLIEQGRIRLRDPVAQFIPEFAAHDKGRITIQQLMTHTSGLAPDLPLDVEFNGTAEAIARASDLTPTAPPGEKFVYSDINFFLLGDIVRRVSGERLDQYSKAHIFEPLGMRDTMFLPPASLRPRIAPTERCRQLAWPCDDPTVPFLRGIVHDPTARRMDNVAGHAGLFSTAADLSMFCRMLLNGGRLGDVRVLAPATVERMTTPSTPAGMKDVRGLGWDIDSAYSSNRGDLFPIGTSYGHTGFTGTSLWLDPTTKSYVIFLSNRVHPDGKGDVTPLRSKVATVAAAALSTQPPASSFQSLRTLTGLDVLEADGFAELQGKHVGLVTNQTGRSRAGVSTIDLLAHASGVTLVALFSPEHGIRGQQDEIVESSRDDKTGLAIHSLYAKTRRPTDDMLKGIDMLVVDLQDIGARFWTYPTTLEYVIEEAAKRDIAVVVIDRPNPIDATDVEGPVQDDAAVGFTGYMKMPIRHGMTMGELARAFAGERRLNVKLSVVAMKNWRRDAWFDDTGVPWVTPSPNMRNLIAATLYPGIGAIEQTNISVGRGTESPFEQIGAPWIDGRALAETLNSRGIPGIRFYPVTFTPSAGAKLGGQSCSGVFMIVTNRDVLRPVRVGVEIASALSKRYGKQFTLEDAATLLGSKATIQQVRAGDDPAAIAASWAADERAWRATRAKYALY
ncbi:MAG TPA: serine hydrolase [Vicinamibacterales bacterium]|nr:serine hydrolase [Vicinamibacterales bacterium]